MPTKHEQGDIAFATHISHGDANHIVLTAGSVQDCYHRTIEAFNAAERFQCPVILLTDAALAMNRQSVTSISTEGIRIDRGKLLTGEDVSDHYLRYDVMISGVSPRFIPGEADETLVVSSVEHDETGLYSEDQKNRVRMTEKRLRKMETARSELSALEIYGDEDAEISLVGIGSTKGPLLETLERLSEEGLSCSYIDLPCLLPFSREEMEQVFSVSDMVIVAEHNSTGQLSEFIQSQIDVQGKIRSIRRFDGETFTPRNLFEQVREVVA
jgi:2-oxoglutarate ferredoxin oxidoreductase subunit alpha